MLQNMRHGHAACSCPRRAMPAVPGASLFPKAGQEGGLTPAPHPAPCSHSGKRRRHGQRRMGSSMSSMAASVGPTPCAAATYDNLALYSSDDAFSESTYWDRRYRSEPATFEWYRGFSSLQPLLLKYFDPQQPLLQVGVGTSLLQLEMVQAAGFKRIVNTDYSQVCIDHMSSIHKGVPELQYQLGDCRDMHQFKEGEFPGVLDKGTLDALMCGDAADRDSRAMLREVHRVLRPGGVYMMITSHSPKSRGSALLLPSPLRWGAVHVYEVGQQRFLHGPVPLFAAAADKPADAGDGSAGDSVNGAGRSGTPGGRGPAPLSKDASKMPTQPYSHFVYVCQKAGQPTDAPSEAADRCKV